MPASTWLEKVVLDTARALAYGGTTGLAMANRARVRAGKTLISEREWKRVGEKLKSLGLLNEDGSITEAGHDTLWPMPCSDPRPVQEL